MTPEEYKGYEDRAAFAEQQIKVLTKRIDDIERRAQKGGSVGGSVDPSVVRALEKMKEIVLKGLFALKKTMLKAQANTKKMAEENEALKTENEKLKYRVAHLKRSLEEADVKLGLQPQSLKKKS
eukprot:CAMPEP_0184479182 /NCGR_PEP_ID=MMETSP0113_2-20130426/1008_1 /TAXON_ID=91329 /ORGANISM="Norrisiella sphaerica, Strain BC52" /LENGTH=123 /DNA_ID=CAMNT_0026857209 /DNA_START=49 /DNA_END=420 /DNA_ORIENTATION=+